VISNLVTLTFIFFRSTEHDHVKDKLPAKLLRIRTFGKMKLNEFKDLLFVADYKMCKTKMVNGPTWYPLTLDVFVKFLYKVICFFYVPQSPPPMFMPVLCFGLFQRVLSTAADTVARLYCENTPEARRSALEIWEAMTKAQDRLIITI
jgi:hypothetical protein